MDPSTESSGFGLIIVLLYFSFPFILIGIAIIAGRLLEQSHLKSLREREAATDYLQIYPTPSFDHRFPVASAELVASSVVVAPDYFKKIIAGIRNFFGGGIPSYQNLLDRARREAILRLKEQAPDSHIIVNLRIETSSITSVHSQKQGPGGVEVLAFATAIRYQKS